MSLVTEDGTGLSNAESYNSTAEIDTYNAAHQAIAAWTNATSDAKERAARNATQYLEARYVDSWKGLRATSSQRLAFPRSGIELDGVWLPSAPLPPRLKEAHAELSIRAVSSPLMPDVTQPGALTAERKKVGPIEIAREWSGGGRSQVAWFRLVDGLLRGLTYGGDDLVRA